MKVMKFFYLLTICLFVSGNLLAQPPCTEYPSPVIQPDFEALCQEPPKEGNHPGQGDRKDTCLMTCENTPVTYSTPATGNTITWEAFGDVSPTTGSGPSFSVTWNSPGGGLIQVTETTIDGCSTTVNVCVKVVESPTAKFTSVPQEVGGIIKVCEGGSVHFQDQSYDDVITWVWDFGDGTQSNDQHPSHQYNTAGSYPVTLTVYNDCGCFDTETVTVEVDPTQAPIIACISTVCINDEATYSVTNGCPGATYVWSTGGTGNIISQSGAQVTVEWNNPFNAQGFLTVEVLGCGNVCEIPTTVVVPVITPNLSVSGPDVVCVGDLVEYSVPPQPSHLFYWFGTASPFFASTPNDHSIEVNWTVAGTYQICVRLSATTALKCQGHDIYCKTVTVKNPFTVQPEFGEMCETDNFTFFTNPSVNSSWVALDAVGGTTTLGSGPNVTVSGLAPGFYEIQATDISGGMQYCNTEASGYLTVQPSAPMLAAADLTPQDPVCPGSTHNYSATPANGYYLTWSTNGTGTVIGSGTDVAITWSGTPPYEIHITQTAMQGPGCPSVTVFPINTVPIIHPTFISPAAQVCVDGQETFSLNSNADVVNLGWEVIPQLAGSIVNGTGTASADVKFNNAPTTGVIIRHHYQICSVDYSVDHVVDVVPFPTINLSVPIDACQNELPSGTGMSAALNFVPSGSSISWSWVFGTSGSTTTTGTSSSVNHMFSNVGTELVTVTATITGGSCPTTITASQLINIKPAPLVNITATNGNAPCPTGSATTLVGSVQNAPGGGGTYSYQWVGGPASPTYPVSSPGTYTLIVTDNVTGCSTQRNFRVYPCDNTPPCTGVDFTISQANCNGFSFNGTLSGGWSNPTWSFGGAGTQSGSGLNVSFEYDHSGYYFVTLTGFNGSQFCRKTYPVIVYFVPDFIAEFSCVNGGGGPSIDVQLIDQTDYLPGTSLSYSWSYPGGGSGVQSPLVGGMPSGNVILTVTDGSTTCTVNHIINVPTPITSAFTTDAPTCAGTPITFDIAPGSLPNIATADWNFGDGSGSNLIPSTQRSYLAPPLSQIVTLTVSDDFGCIATSTQTITMDPAIATVNITAPANPACTTPPFVLSATATGGTPGYSFDWFSADMTTSHGSGSNSAALGASGDYVVVVTDANGCTERSDIESVIIIPNPVAFILSQDDYCVDDQIDWNGNQGGGFSYNWTFTGPSGPASSTSPNVSFIATVAGTYTAQLTLTDGLTGCSNTSTISTSIVHDGPQGLAIANVGPNCVPATLTASVSPSVPVNYVWSTGDTGPTTIALGGGTVEVTAYNAQGCSASETVDIGEGPDMADVAVGCYCYPEPIQWTAPQGFGYSYAWYMVSSPSDVYLGNNFQQLFNTSGIYYVVVTDYYGCSNTSDYIHITIGEECDCKFEVRPLDLQCVGLDPVTGGTIYSFSTTVTNYYAALTGLNGISNEGVITSISPTSIAGGGAMTTVTGTFVLYPGYNYAVITFQAAGANGLLCDYKLEVQEFPDCTSKPCDVKWGNPKLKCIFTYNGFNYYDFSISATNYGNTLTNLVWFPCSNPNATITSNTNTLPTNTSTQMQGMIRVPSNASSDCYTVCGFDPVTEEKCCWDFDISYPECGEYQEPCKDVEIKEATLKCGTPSVDFLGNLVYDFDITFTNHFPNGTAYLIPFTNQSENHVTNLNVNVSGYNYQITGSVVDMPTFNSPLCFWVVTYDGAEVCWTKICLKRPSCKKAVGQAEAGFRNNEINIASDVSLQVAPNPASSYINVRYEMPEEGIVELKMLSVDGQLVHHTSSLNTIGNVQINTSELADGMYFLGVYKDGALMDQQKVVVLKQN